MRGLLFTLLTTACATTPEPTRLEDCAAVEDAVVRGESGLSIELAAGADVTPSSRGWR